MKKKVGLITGISGQDGSYLAEYLLSLGYEVWGMIRRNSTANSQTKRIEHLLDNKDLHLEYGDLLDMASIVRILQLSKPDEVYNLAAQSHVRVSFDQPIFTAQATGLGVLNLLESVRLICPKTKMYQASSSEMFGNNIDKDKFQRETTPLTPVSPYGCAKVFAYNLMRNYRESYDMFLTNGILFNHESPRRGETFVTNKVAKVAAQIYMKKENYLYLGNLEASRDWSHAEDMVKAMHMMMQLEKPNDYVCASGISHTVGELCEVAFSYLGMDYKKYVKLDEKFLRPEELDVLRGDASKLKTATGWEPEIDFKTMIEDMVEHWLEIL